MTTDEKRDLCEEVAADLLGKMKGYLPLLKEAGIGVTLFTYTFEPGATAYISTGAREDVLVMLKEFIAGQEAGITTEPRGERGRG